MTLTKAERKKLRALKKRAQKVEREAGKLARDTEEELRKQMRKS